MGGFRAGAGRRRRIHVLGRWAWAAKAQSAIRMRANCRCSRRFPGAGCVVRDPGTYPLAGGRLEASRVPRPDRLPAPHRHLVGGGRRRERRPRRPGQAPSSMSPPGCLTSATSASTPSSFCRSRSTRTGSAQATAARIISRRRATSCWQPGAEFDRHLTQINRLFASFGKPGLSAAQLQPGTNQLKCLVDLCHMHGIAAILGLVYTHAGGKSDDASIWFFDRQPNTDPEPKPVFHRPWTGRWRGFRLL